MVTLEHTIRMLKIPLLEDGVISLGETSLLLRAVRPYTLRGSGDACELRDLLMQVRRDGIITPNESARICQLLDRITNEGIRLEEYVREIPDFPTPGVRFRDTTGLFDTPFIFNAALEMIAEALADIAFDFVAAPEARGFILGAAVAAKFGKAFVPIRRAGKLPRATASAGYDTEHGHVEWQMHADAVVRGERAVIVDDLVATGATAATAARLVEKLGGKVAQMVFAAELEGCRARETALKGYPVFSVTKYAD